MIDAGTMTDPDRSRIVTYAAPLRAAAPPQAAATARPRRSGAIRGGWAVLAVGMALSMIPGYGLAMWVLFWIFCGVSFILSIVGLATGQTLQGILLMLASITLGPAVMIAIGPMIGSAFL
jgi:hypothetical protein